MPLRHNAFAMNQECPARRASETAVRKATELYINY